MQQGEPRYRWGSIGPKKRTGPDPVHDAGEPLLPPDVLRIDTGIDISDYTTEGVEEALGRYWDCVDEVVSQGADRVTLGGLPISAQLGRTRVRQIIQETNERTGLPADVDAEAVVAAMRHLGVRRVAIASRWAKELNDKLIAYLEAADLEVVAITSEGQWAKEAFGMSVDKGIKLAFQLSRKAMREAPEADGLLVPGGTWRSLPAVPILEDEFHKPVFTNSISQIWRLIHEGIAPPVEGWGRLLATP
jgi:maleate cis-trans isomerase